MIEKMRTGCCKSDRHSLKSESGEEIAQKASHVGAGWSHASCCDCLSAPRSSCGLALNSKCQSSAKSIQRHRGVALTPARVL